MSSASVQRTPLGSLRAGARFRFTFIGRPLGEWFRVGERGSDGEHVAVEGAPFALYHRDAMVWAARGDRLSAVGAP